VYSQGRRREYSLHEALDHAGFEPDLIVALLFGPLWFLRGMETCPYPLVAQVYDSSFNHFWLRHYLRLFDRVFVDFKNSIPRLAKEGIHANWLPYSVDPDAFVTDGPVEKDLDIGFVGVTDQRPRRQALFDLLSRDFKVGVAGAIDGKGRLGFKEMAAFYARCRIVVNECLYDGVNFRVFEALASGSFLLTEATENGLHELFTPGRHLDTYAPETLLEKVDYYLDHDAEREAIAAEGQRLVMSEHTQKARAEQMLEIAGEGAGRRIERDTAARCSSAGQAVYHFCLRWPQTELRELPFATSLLEDAVARRPHDGHARWTLGLIRARMGEDGEALDELNQATTLLPDECRVMFHMGHMLHFLGHEELALRSFQLGLARCDGALAEPLALARTLVDQGRLDADLWLALGSVLDSLGLGIEPNASLFVRRPFPLYGAEYFFRAAQEGRSEDGLIAVADTYARSGDASAALDVYQVALQMGVREPPALFAAGVQMLKCFRREEGLYLIERAVQEMSVLRDRLSDVPLQADEWVRMMDDDRSGTRGKPEERP
jgi:tetratricopeptide (TPR) repeat protein